MHHLRSKLVLTLLIATLLMVLPSYFLVKSLLQHSLKIGLNENVEIAMEDAATISRQLYSRLKSETLDFAENLAQQDQIIQLTRLRQGYLEKPINFNSIIQKGRIELYDLDLNRLATFTNDSTHTYPNLNSEKLSPVLNSAEATFLPTVTDPNFISVSAPVIYGRQPVGLAVVIKCVDPEFTKSVQNIVEINQMFKSLGFYSDDISSGLMKAFLVVYACIALISSAVGYYFARRFTAPILKLAKGTQIVAAGNLDYRMEVSTNDEIGQLVDAFNKMIATIKEKQEIAREEALRRQRIEVEHQQKVKDLEMAELRERALEAENARKSIELEKAQELEKAYQALEASHRELQETQAQLVQSAKMASLGSLAAGVAHEINNPIGAINSAADVTIRVVKRVNETLENAGSIKELLENPRFKQILGILTENTQLIKVASQRVVKIVRSLKTFARLDEAKFQRADLHEGIESTLMLLQHELKNRIAIEKDYGNLPPIFYYPDEMNQVFMNILANAAQAIPDKGTIRIQTYLKEPLIYIKIQDTGKGIPSENLSKIFDPGFTTKGVGVGTGLGLSISYAILQKHKGKIKVESEVGKGTTFTLVLPRVLTKD